MLRGEGIYRIYLVSGVYITNTMPLRKSTKPRKRRRIAYAKINFISLCRQGVNNMPVLLKGEDSVAIEVVTKAVENGRLLRGIVQLANQDDLEAEFMDPETVRKTATDFLTRRGSIDMEHDFQALDGKADIAASWIVDPGDSRFQGWTDLDGKPVNTAGAWAVEIDLKDPELQAAAARGEINGLSMGGQAIFQEVSKSTDGDDPAGSATDNPDNPTMDRDQILEALGLKPEPTNPLTALVAAEVQKSVGPIAQALEEIKKSLEGKGGDGADSTSETQTPTELDPFTAPLADLQKSQAESMVRQACAGLDPKNPEHLQQILEVRRVAEERFGGSAEQVQKSAMDRFNELASGGPVSPMASAPSVFGQTNPGVQMTGVETKEPIKKSVVVGGDTEGRGLLFTGIDAAIAQSAQDVVKDMFGNTPRVGKQLSASN